MRLDFVAALALLVAGCAQEAETVGDSAGGNEPEDCEAIVAAAETKSAEIANDPGLSEEEQDIATIRVWNQTGRCGMRPMAADEPDAADISVKLAALYREAMSAARSAKNPNADCRSQIGDRNADALEAVCSSVSGRTYPPCNAANSCELLIDEVQFNCDFLVERYPNLCSAAAP